MNTVVRPPRKTWHIKEADESAVSRLAEVLGISRITARLLVVRGYDDPGEAMKFLKADHEYLHDPFLFAQMEKAVARLLEAREKGERILVHGDYDVDGLAAAALLVNGFGELGIETDFFLPHRLNDGYGLQEEKMLSLADEDYALAVTVDCGISAPDIIGKTQSRGVDVILTDHHHPPAEIPAAYAVINPHVPGEPYPFKDLCGVGVAWKLLQALAMRAENLDDDEVLFRFENFLDCVAIGTVADVVPVIEENRGLIKLGLTAIRENPRPGIQALVDASGLTANRVTAQDIGFLIAPRLNALGRLGEAKEAVELLTTRNLTTAQTIAQRMEEVNNERKSAQEEMTRNAAQVLDKHPEYLDQKFLLLASPDWHRGILGIVAARVQERFHRPTALLAIEDGMAYGSARSIPGYNVVEALEASAELLEAYGGHQGAAGFRLPADRIDALRQRLAEHAESHLSEETLEPILDIDAEVRLQDLTEKLCEEIDLLEPYGHGNRRPVLAVTGIQAESAARIVGNNHLKMDLRQKNQPLDAIGFGMGEHLNLVFAGPVDLAFRPRINRWQDRNIVQLQIVDLRASSVDPSQRMTPTATSTATGSSTLQLIDSRNVADKAKAIMTALGDGRRAVFFCVSVEGRKELVKILGGTRIESALELPSELADLVRDEGGLLVRMKAGDQKDMSIGHIFFYDLPPGPNLPKRIIDVARKINCAIKIHLLFGESDIPAARRKVDALLPDRDVLGRVYQLMRDAAYENRVKRDILARRLEENQIDPLCLDRGMAVFDEMFLIKRLSEDGDFELVKVTGKRDLKESKAYQKIQEQRARLLAFQESLMKESSEGLQGLLKLD